MFDTSFCLRPTLTELMVQRLGRGDSINLYGQGGSGKTRLLEDIGKLHLPDTQVVYLSLKGLQFNFAGFLGELGPLVVTGRK